MMEANRQLPFSLASFQTVYDPNPQAFCIICVSKVHDDYDDITFVYANAAYEQLSGFSREQLIGHTYTELLGQRSPQWNKLYGDAAYLGKTQHTIVQGPEIGGYVSIQCYQIAPGYCGSNVLDVTAEICDTKRAREESRESTRRVAEERSAYQTLLDQSSAMITVIDAETYRVIYANAAASEVTKGFDGGYVGSVCYESIAHRGAPCPGCILLRQGTPEETRELSYGGRAYRMLYKRIMWHGREALMEYSEDVTEQKQLMRLAEENAQQHALIIANIPTGIIVYKIEEHTYKLLQLNPAICDMMGITPESAVGSTGMSIVQLVHPDDRRIVTEAAIRMAVPGTAVHYEFRSRTRDGRGYVWFAADGKSAVQADGSIYVYIGYRDITDSKERELEFQQKVDFIANLNDDKLISKGRHNLTRNTVLMLEARKDGAVVGRPGGKYDDLLPILVNTATLPAKQEELRRTLSREHLLASFSQGTREFAIDYRRRLEDGTLVWATLKGSLYEEPGTHDVIAFLYSYDSTDQIQETQMVNRLSFLEYGLLGLIDLRTRQYKTVYMKDVPAAQYRDMHGDYDAMIAARCALPTILGDGGALREQMRLDTILAQLESRSIYEAEYSATSKAGAFQRVRFHYSYLDEMKDTVIFYSFDITESYQRDQAQIHRVEQALYEAQEAGRAKAAFFSRMSHDMRTPMNGILGMAALSEGETNVAVLKENMRKIRESGQYLLSLINDTLDIQRIESGRMKLVPQIINTMEVVENILDMVRTAANAKGVQLRFDPGNADLKWYVRADPVRIKQVFVNLLSNAVKFTPPGGTVELASQLISREGMISHDVFTVRDTGIGMSEAFLKSGIFQPFSQENNQITAQYAGSGLGLSIAKSLIELMGGSIAVESELGVGTTFTIHLALERVDAGEAEHQLNKRKHRSESLTDVLRGHHVLLCEDHPLNAEIARKLLMKVGCDVTWMPNGQAALDCFALSAPHEYDVILMDIRMPVMDGLEATRRIRALERPDARTVPVIAMTANAYDEDVRKSMEAGMNDHLGKPVEPSQLYEAIARFLSPKP